MWYLEDPVTLVHKTADPALKEQPTAWRRVYGPFKNGLLGSVLHFACVLNRVRGF